jgi:hypothetical protein
MEMTLPIAAYLRSWDRYRSKMLPSITPTETAKETFLMFSTMSLWDILPSL